MPSGVGKTSHEWLFVVVVVEMVPNQQTGLPLNAPLGVWEHRALTKQIVSSPFSSSLLAFFLNVFHHDARSRFEGGDAVLCDVGGICCGGAPTVNP